MLLKSSVRFLPMPLQVPAIPMRNSRTWTAKSASSRLESVPRPEDGPDSYEAGDQECHDHREADNDVDIGNAIEGPAEAADEIHDRIEQGHFLPDRRQHGNGVEAAAQKGQGRDHHQRNDLQFFKAIGPDTNEKAEEAEGEGNENERSDHPQRMGNAEGHKQ